MKSEIKWRRTPDGLLQAQVNDHKVEIKACKSGRYYTGDWTVLVDDQYVTQAHGMTKAKNMGIHAAGGTVEVPKQEKPRVLNSAAKTLLREMFDTETDLADKAKLAALIERYNA
jgi:hypothetical protein